MNEMCGTRGKEVIRKGYIREWRVKTDENSATNPPKTLVARNLFVERNANLYIHYTKITSLSLPVLFPIIK